MSGDQVTDGEPARLAAKHLTTLFTAASRFSEDLYVISGLAGDLPGLREVPVAHSVHELAEALRPFDAELIGGLPLDARMGVPMLRDWFNRLVQEWDWG